MKYIKSDSYEEYKQSQIQTNIGKLDKVWITDHEIDTITSYVKENNIAISNGVCHGARNGYEVQKFRKNFNANIIGTDISDTALQFDNLVVWDMHDRNEEWINKFDFIYSNSIDHSYDFSSCLDIWMESLTDNGRCFIHWSGDMERPYNTSDCFGCSKQELVDLVTTKYQLVSILNVNGKGHDACVIVIKK